MKRILRHLLLAMALLFSQQAAQLHAFSHFKRDMALALGDKKTAPPISHPAEQCLAFHAVDSFLPGVSQPGIARCAVPPYLASFRNFLPVAARIVFDSRAPPSVS